MTAFDPRCFVYSYKEGLLSKLAHDLKLTVRDITVEASADGSPAVLRFDARSIDLVCRMHEGKEDVSSISSGDRAKILQTLKKEVLRVDRYPEIVLSIDSATAEGDGFRVRAKLLLCGRERTLETLTKRAGDRQVAEVTIHQPEYGIAPYSAMLGALKVRADVRVVVDLLM